MVSVLLLLILGVLTVIGWFLKDFPILYRSLRVEEYKHRSQQNLQVESFFKQIKGSEIASTFEYWTGVILDMENSSIDIETPQGYQKFSRMQQQVFMYGSERTVNILTAMTQNQYLNESRKKVTEVSSNNDYNSKIESYVLMIYIAYLVSSLKQDFTGYKVKPINILKIKINDIDSMENKENFSKAEKKVKEGLKRYGIES